MMIAVGSTNKLQIPIRPSRNTARNRVGVSRDKEIHENIFVLIAKAPNPQTSLTPKLGRDQKPIIISTSILEGCGAILRKPIGPLEGIVSGISMVDAVPDIGVSP